MEANVQAATTLNPPEPAGPPGTQYSIDELIPSNIQPFINQADYTKKTGQMPPTYNPAAPLKGWVDTAPPKGVDPIVYHTIHLDPSLQNAVETDISVPAFMAIMVNIVPDEGPFTPPSAGTMLTPRRQLATDEELVVEEGSVIEVKKIAAPAPATGAGFNKQDQMMLSAIYAKVVGPSPAVAPEAVNSAWLDFVIQMAIMATKTYVQSTKLTGPQKTASDQFLTAGGNLLQAFGI